MILSTIYDLKQQHEENKEEFENLPEKKPKQISELFDENALTQKEYLEITDQIINSKNVNFIAEENVYNDLEIFSENLYLFQKKFLN